MTISVLWCTHLPFVLLNVCQSQKLSWVFRRDWEVLSHNYITPYWILEDERLSVRTACLSVKRLLGKYSRPFRRRRLGIAVRGSKQILSTEVRSLLVRHTENDDVPLLKNLRDNVVLKRHVWFLMLNRFVICVFADFPPSTGCHRPV